MDRHEYLNSLIEFAKTSNLEEVVLEQGEIRFAFKRNLAPPPPPKPAPAAKTKLPPVVQGHFILSPMVGTFKRSDKDRPPYILEGSEVESGERVAVVEAMNVHKDVISDVKGKIIRILVENGKPVEYGQRLFEVQPHV